MALAATLSCVFHHAIRLGLPVTESLRLLQIFQYVIAGFEAVLLCAQVCWRVSVRARCGGAACLFGVWVCRARSSLLPSLLAAAWPRPPAPAQPRCDRGSRRQFPFLAPPHRSTMAALISVCDFVRQAQEDLSSPTTSSFASHMGRCKATANSLEEVSRGGGPWGCTPRGWGGGLSPSWPCRSCTPVQASPYNLSLWVESGARVFGCLQNT